MELLFLGSGAAEGNPAAYCRCEVCEGIRERGGIEIKSRASVRFDTHYQIDISPDHYWQMLRHNTDMYDVEHLLITHSHEDHFSLPAISDKTMSRVTNNKPLNIYLSKPAADYGMGLVKNLMFPEEKLKDLLTRFIPVPLDYFETYQVGDLSVTTIKGAHKTHVDGEYSINYLITTRDGTTLLYALDTGYYQDETWEFLDGLHTDVLIMDSTFGGRTDRGEYPFGHLDCYSFLKMLDRMSDLRFIDPDTSLYATHFNPHTGFSHHRIQEFYSDSSYDVIAAHDGLVIDR